MDPSQTKTTYLFTHFFQKSFTELSLNARLFWFLGNPRGESISSHDNYSDKVDKKIIDGDMCQKIKTIRVMFFRVPGEVS